MDKAKILEWIKSFEGVTPEKSTSYEALHDGISLITVYNALSDDTIESSALITPKNKDDWVSIMRNVKLLTGRLQAQLEKIGAPTKFDTISIARLKNIDDLDHLVKCLVRFAVAGPKKEKVLSSSFSSFLTELIFPGESPSSKASSDSKTDSTPNQAVSESKSIQSSSKTAANPVPPKAESNSPSESTISSKTAPEANEKLADLKSSSDTIDAPKTSPTIPESVPQASVSSPEKSNSKELEDLKIQKQKLIEQLNKLSEPVESPASAQLAALQQQKIALIAEDKELEAKIKSFEGAEEKWKTIQQEIAFLETKLLDLKKSNPNSLERFANSSNPEVIKLIRAIKDAEKAILPESIQTLKDEVTKYEKMIVSFKDASLKMKSVVQKMPKTNDTEQAEVLKKQIDDFVAKNNVINEQILRSTIVLDSIEQLKQNQSFLEQLLESCFNFSTNE